MVRLMLQSSGISLRAIAEELSENQKEMTFDIYVFNPKITFRVGCLKKKETGKGQLKLN